MKNQLTDLEKDIVEGTVRSIESGRRRLNYTQTIAGGDEARREGIIYGIERDMRFLREFGKPLETDSEQLRK